MSSTKSRPLHSNDRISHRDEGRPLNLRTSCAHKRRQPPICKNTHCNISQNPRISPAATLWSPSGTGTYLQNPIRTAAMEVGSIDRSNSGYVVGLVQVGDGDFAVLWSPSGTPTLLASGFIASQVNDSGQSIGQIVEGPKFSSRAALWSSTGSLTTLQGLRRLDLRGSNQQIWVCCWNGSKRNRAAAYLEAVMWSPTGNVTVLQDKGGLGYSEAFGINALRQSVGFVRTSAGKDEGDALVSEWH